MNQLVQAERAAPAEVFQRWRQTRAAALAALRAADPKQPMAWVETPMKPATLATTRLAECWAHGLDITGPLGIDFPDTDRLRNVAWLAHRTLPYATVAWPAVEPYGLFCRADRAGRDHDLAVRPGGPPTRRSPARPARSAGWPRSGSHRSNPGCARPARTAAPRWPSCAPTPPDRPARSAQ